MSVLDKYLVGWGKLEAVLLACVANGMNLMLLGKHGCGKSSIARFLADAHQEGDKKVNVGMYHCDKENLISFVGIPDPQALKEGRIEYATHERSVFNQDVLLLDELPRATKEGQNMFLEALQEKTIFGKPLKYKFVVATGNDETYKANYKLDPALLDRFYVVLPAPTTSGTETGFSAEELRDLIELNLGKRKAGIKNANKELITIIKSIRKEYKNFLLNIDIRANIVEFCSRYFSVLISNIKEMSKGAKNALYIPPRIIGEHFPRLIMAIAAYFKAVGDDDNVLQRACELAITYSLGTKLGIPIDKLLLYYEPLKELLSEDSGKLNRIRVEMTTGPIASRVNTISENAELINKSLEIAEMVNAIGSLLQEVDSKKDEDIATLKKLSSVLEEHSMNDTCKNIVTLSATNIALRKDINVLEEW